MIGMADLSGPALLRWQFPDLDAPAGADRIAAPIEECADATPEHDAPDAVANSGSDDPPCGVSDDVVAAEIARGYAEGLQRGVAEGNEKGYADGFAAGAQASQRALADEARRLAAIVERLAVPMPALERLVEDALVALALEVARCVIGSEVGQSRDSLARLIREALVKAPIRIGGLRIALNPADLDLVRTLAPDLEAGGAALVGDTAVEAGGCVIVFDEDDRPIKDRRWHPRTADGAPHIDLSLAARWRSAMLALFDGEGK
jgi:flagellar assembly protein FliH